MERFEDRYAERGANPFYLFGRFIRGQLEKTRLKRLAMASYSAIERRR